MLPLLFARLLHFHGTDAKLRVFRHERWIPAKWTNCISSTGARSSSASRKVDRGARERRTGRDAMDDRAGIPLRAPDRISSTPATCRRRRSTGRARSCAPGAASSSSSGAADAGRLLRRSRGQARAGAAHGQRIRARRCAISTRRRWPTSSSARSPRCARRTSAIRRRGRRSTSSASAILEKVRPAVAPNLHGDLRRDRRASPMTVARRCASASRASATSSRRASSRSRERRRRRRADRSLRGRGQAAREPPGLCPDEHDSLPRPSHRQRPDVAGQGSQRRRAAHLRRPAASARA